MHAMSTTSLAARYRSARLVAVSVATAAVLTIVGACGSGPPSDQSPRSGTGESALRTQIALVTDFGSCDSGAPRVAAMVDAWDPEIIATAGDNSQNDDNGCLGYDKAVEPYYGKYINDPEGPRFYPAIGNHDYSNVGAGLAAYNAYFDYLDDSADPQSRWYATSIGQIDLFMVDTEGDPATLEPQRTWLQDQLTASKSNRPEAWRIVIMHRGPFTSGVHGPHESVQPAAGWSYAQWGADAVIGGHQHIYDHYVVDGFNYFTAGISNLVNARECVSHHPDEQTCIEGPGAMKIVAAQGSLTLQYWRLLDDDTNKLADAVNISR